MNKKYHHKVFIYSDTWKFIRCAKVLADVNLHGILREGLFLYSDSWKISDEHIGGVVEIVN